MKVFKFYLGDLYYAYSGHDLEQAKETMLYENGEVEIDKVEEIPESEWDKKFITMYEDNNYSKKPYFVSIRDNMMGEESTMVFTNDSF